MSGLSSRSGRHVEICLVLALRSREELEVASVEVLALAVRQGQAPHLHLNSLTAILAVVGVHRVSYLRLLQQELIRARFAEAASAKRDD